MGKPPMHRGGSAWLSQAAGFRHEVRTQLGAKASRQIPTRSLTLARQYVGFGFRA